jgi:hypothetical protein
MLITYVFIAVALVPILYRHVITAGLDKTLFGDDDYALAAMFSVAFAIMWPTLIVILPIAMGTPAIGRIVKRMDCGR